MDYKSVSPNLEMKWSEMKGLSTCMIKARDLKVPFISSNLLVPYINRVWTESSSRLGSWVNRTRVIGISNGVEFSPWRPIIVFLHRVVKFWKKIVSFCAQYSNGFYLRWVENFEDFNLVQSITIFSPRWPWVIMINWLITCVQVVYHFKKTGTEVPLPDYLTPRMRKEVFHENFRRSEA